MIGLVNNWNKDFTLFSLLNTLANYRETKKILKGEYTARDLGKLTEKDGGKFEEPIQKLISENWLKLSNDKFLFTENLRESSFCELIIALCKDKNVTYSGKEGIEILVNSLQNLEIDPADQGSRDYEGILFAPVFHYLSQIKPAARKKFLSSDKNKDLASILTLRSFIILQKQGYTWTTEGSELISCYEKTGMTDLTEEIVSVCLRKNPASKRDLLTERLLKKIDENAENGYYFENKSPEEQSEKTYLPAVLFRNLEKRPYGMRRSRATDLPVLTKLETLCWPSGLEISGDKLLNRISRFPDGQWVATQNKKVVGALYSQRINDASQLPQCNMDMVEELYDGRGDTVQLLAVNVHPDVQDLQIGGGLLEFVLQRVPLIKGLEKVVGVTRCRSYQKHAPMDYTEYVSLRNDNGALFDPVLRYHELHGATIVQPIDGYRKRDPENAGYGVLVSYDIYNRVRKDFKISKESVNTSIPVEELVEETIQKLLGDLYEERYEAELPLMEIGLDSSDLMVLRETIETALDEKISASFFFENSTAQLVMEALADKSVAAPEKSAVREEKPEKVTQDWKDTDIAVVSYSFRFPGATTKEELWQILTEKKSMISDLPDNRFSFPDRIDINETHKGIQKGGYLDDIAGFDAPFFRISPAEAELMDPQQRILMELAWEAIERANTKPSDFKGSSTGVFIGASGSDYELSLRENVDEASLTGTGTALAILPNRISYFFDFDGPSLQIDTACSSSLVAIHEAVKSINSGECDSALVGAINLICHPHKNLSYHQNGMLSEDGRCHTFDEKANGYVRGEGAAVLWLKPMAKALEDGDTIRGVIKGSAINHGGQAGGLTVPNPTKQRELVEKAFRNAGIDAKEVSYMEAHGTGTPLGDPIEVDGLKNAFSALTKEKPVPESCGIGSVKTNIGHLEAAAGLAGMIKVLLAMEKKQIPPTNNFNQLSSKIDLTESPFYIQEHLKEWNKPRLIAGVSSFGIGGANGHVVLEGFEPVEKMIRAEENIASLFVLSAKNEKTLQAYAQRYVEFLSANQDFSPGALCYAAQTGRQEMDFRLAIIGETVAEIKSKLTAFCARQETDSLFFGNARKGNPEQRGKEFNGVLSSDRLDVIAEAWIDGAKINWQKLHGSKVFPSPDLPVYPFDRKPYWFKKEDQSDKPFVSQKVLQALPTSSFWDNAANGGQGLKGLIAVQKYSDEIAIIRLQSELNNSLNEELTDDLMTAFLAIRNEKAFKAVILTGNDKAFSIEGSALTTASEKIRNFVYRALPDFDLPVIAAVNGNATGSGLIFALTADVIILSGGISINAAADRSGIHTGKAFSYVLSEKLGKQTASEMMLFGREIESQHIANRATSIMVAEEALTEALAIAQQMAGQSVENLRLSKKELNNTFRNELIRLVATEKNVLVSQDTSASPKPGRISAPKAQINLVALSSEVEVLALIKKTASAISDIPVEDIDGSVALGELGFDEVFGSQLIAKINEKLQTELSVIDFRESETLNALAETAFSSINREKGFDAANTDGLNTQLYTVQWLKAEIKRQAGNFEKEIVILADTGADVKTKLSTPEGKDLIVIAPKDALSFFTEVFDRVKTAVTGKTKTFFTVVLKNEELSAYGFVAGIFKTLVHECDHVRGKVVGIDSFNSEDIANLISRESGAHGVEVSYRGENRYEKGIMPGIEKTGSSFSFNKDGVYLITGGSGGLGKLFGEFLKAEYGCRVAVCGRRKFEATGLRDETFYYQCDISNPAETIRMVNKITTDHGRLDGVIHAAGVSNDAMMANKTRSHYEKVLAPKVSGTINLDEATRHLNLDCFILFSSNASITSNIGQTDYSSANTYLDLFAEKRSGMVEGGHRSGRTLSISWPLWADGGMQFGSDVEAHLYDKWGMKPLPAGLGIELFRQMLSTGHHHHFAMYGDVNKFNQKVGVRESTTADTEGLEVGIKTETVSPLVTEIVAEILKLETSEIPDYESFGNLGFDSITLRKLSTLLEDRCGVEITPMAFYNHNSIEELVAHLQETYQAELTRSLSSRAVKNETNVEVDAEQVTDLLLNIVADLLKLEKGEIPTYESFGNLGFDSISLKKFATLLDDQYQIDVTPMVFYNHADIESLAIYLKEAYTDQLIKAFETGQQASNIPDTADIFSQPVPGDSSDHSDATKKRYSNEPIAIVGISGRFPQSPDLDTFWKNLEENRDLITEIPEERWKWEDYYGDNATDPMKTKVKWGGFIEDVDKFDPFFFNISPREAEVMDPQHRIALEAVYHALEDAGIVPETLAGTNTGIFMGSYFDDYFSIVNEAGQYKEAQSLAGLSQSMLVNRISYLLDIHGPSEPVDTACSSSLVAIHRAVDHLRKGRCEMVMAGGVSLDLKPYLYLTLTQAGMLSEDGRCKTFDDAANGYARGEGVGVVVLKTLKKAKEDGDRIYGLIRGTAENHGGKANTLTSPNPNAQKDLLVEAYTDAGVDPAQVTYIEAHGTGTPLGDPIETEGLKAAFAELFRRSGKSAPQESYCGLGSVKTNTGHLEAAAGIIGVIKVLLSMKHGLLPGNPQLKNPNQYLKLENSPFYLIKDTTEWKTKGAAPMIAGVSSFGFGGTNAHVVLESYKEEKITQTNKEQDAYLFLLSARDEERLKEYATITADYLERHTELQSSHIAYTSQIGRSAMEERAAVAFNSKEDLILQLRSLAKGDKGNLIRGRVKPGSEFSSERSFNSFDIFKENELKDIAQHWIEGARIDWKGLYASGPKPSIVSLPGYPFARERYWVEEKTGDKVQKPFLHPLLHENISDLYGQKFRSAFDGNEEFLNDHRINGVKILPGVSYIEMVREAGERSIGKKITAIREITWVEPVKGDSGATLEVEISPYEDHLSYKVISLSNGQKIIHGEGDLYTTESDHKANIDPLKIKAGLTEEVSGGDFYTNLKKRGYDYGSTFRGVKKIWSDGNQALAEISLPENQNFKLSPGLLDSALHPALLLAGNDEVLLPYHIGDLQIISPLRGQLMSHVTKIDPEELPRGVNGFNVTIAEPNGRVLVTIERFITLPGKASNEKAHVYGVNWVSRKAEQKTSDVEKIIWIAGEHPTLGSIRVDHLSEIDSLSVTNQEELLIKLTDKVKELSAKKKEVLFQIIYENSQRAHFGSLIGFFRSMNRENPALKGKLIGLDSLTVSEIEKVIESEGDQADDIRIVGSDRQIINIEKIALSGASAPTMFQPNGVYLITGGAGAIGRSIIGRIMQIPGAKVIATGRSKSADLSEFDTTRVRYEVCDVADRAQVHQLTERIRSSYEKLNGVIHSAGVIRDDFIINKTIGQIAEVVRPKVNGIINLDHATRDEQLDFFVAMASLSGFGGNIGQSDYAAANAFMDEFIKERAEKVKAGQRHGSSVSLDWSLWKEGGMKIDQNSEQYLEDTFGIRPFPNEKAVATMEQIVGTGQSGQFVVTYGQKEFQLTTGEKLPVTSTASTSGLLVDEDWKSSSLNLIRELLAEELRMKPEKMQKDVPFENYGIDSILINKITNQLDTVFGRLPRTLFFEYQTLGELTEYFIEEHADTLQAKFSSDKPSADEPVSEEKRMIRLTESIKNSSDSFASGKDDEEIAIIGLSGRYPGADNLEEFWDNLKQGKDSITEIPNDRWDLDKYYDADPSVKGKISSKWGGFINDVDKFDPVFFKISPREAEIIDPQERLFLQTAWSAVEDAGYTRASLHQDKTKQNLGGNVGVFVGVMYEEYQLFGAEQTLMGNPMALWGSPSSIANRVSYFFDLHGPSMAIDTMCSSSITAIHLACESLKKGETDFAIAGGVNVSIHPNKYIMLSNGKFISAKGRCESFGEGGEGYIPGEGVGAVLLKPLSKAKADGDQIYGIIKSTSLNHGGKTNGYTVPNPKAQAALIRSAIDKAGVQPEDFSYIEAHGTGTSLGDPIEIAGLSKAFNTDKKQYCAIGSVKSNIGHGESAAGISGLTKMLLQLKNRKLVPSLHSSSLNPHIDFENSPFRVQQQLTDWETKNDQPRLAGLSSFGAGGGNAHIIIEEYVDNQHITEITDSETLIVLSARNEERLKTVAENLLAYLRKHEDLRLHDVAATLMNGREHMTERLAFTAGSVNELINKLDNFLKGQTAGLIVDNIRQYHDDNIGQPVINPGKLTDADSSQLSKLAADWTKGRNIDWTAFYERGTTVKVSLPTYPFLKKRYWYDSSQPVKKASVASQTVSEDSLLVSKKAEMKIISVAAKEQVVKPENGKIAVRLNSPSDAASLLKKSNDHPAIPKINLSDIQHMGIATETRQFSADLQPDLHDKVEKTIPEKVTGPTGSDLIEVLKTSLSEVLFLEVSEIDDHEKFIDLGLDSVVGVEWVSKINDLFSIELQATRLYDFPTLALLSAHISADNDVQVRAEQEDSQSVAIADNQKLVTETDTEALKSLLTESLAKVLYLEIGEIDEHEKFVDLGLDSVIGVEWVSTINDALGTELNATRLYDFPTVSALAGYLAEATTHAVQSPIAQPAQTSESETRNVMVNISVIREDLRKSLAEVLYLDFEEIDDHEKFVDLGLDSVVGVEWVSGINEKYDTGLEATRLYDYPTVSLLAEYLAEIVPAEEKESSKTASQETIAAQVISAERPDLKPELTKTLAEVLYLDETEIDEHEKFIDLGLDSVVGVEWVSTINDLFGLELEATRLYDYPSIHALTAFIQSQMPETMTSSSEIKTKQSDEDKLRDLLDRVASGQLSADEADDLFLQTINPN